MKIAVIFSGRIKSYEQQLEYLMNLQNKFNLDFYCSINQENIDLYHQNFLNLFKVKEYNFEKSEYNEEWNKYNSKYCVNKKNTVSRFYNDYKCFKLIEQYQYENNFKYDIILKFRADIVSTNEFNFIENIEKNTIYIPNEYDHCGLNDQIAYGNFDTMKIYCDIYNQIENLCKEGVDFHPESLVLNQILKNNIRIIRFNYYYHLNNNRL